MQLYIASDIHGSATKLEQFFKIVDLELKKHSDTKVVLLGDTYNHGPRNPLPEGYAPMRVARLLNDAMSFVTAIKGNCDSEVDEMISNFPIIGDFDMDWNGRTLFFTHGHKCNPELPPSRGKAGDIVFYGHFHKPLVTVKNGITYICVGSIGLPFDGSKPTYAVIDEKKIVLKTFDGEVLQEIAL
ncbi:MAG: phosphodiesterase [Clostridia bacterium]